MSPLVVKMKPRMNSLISTMRRMNISMHRIEESTDPQNHFYLRRRPSPMSQPHVECVRHPNHSCHCRCQSFALWTVCPFSIDPSRTENSEQRIRLSIIPRWLCTIIPNRIPTFLKTKNQHPSWNNRRSLVLFIRFRQPDEIDDSHVIGVRLRCIRLALNTYWTSTSTRKVFESKLTFYEACQSEWASSGFSTYPFVSSGVAWSHSSRHRRNRSYSPWLFVRREDFSESICTANA